MNEDFILYLIITGATILYFLPFIISCRRKHSHKFAILTLNLIMGLSGIGWVASFIWAFYDNKHK